MSGAMIFLQEDLKIKFSLESSTTSDYIGRRYSIVLASVLFLLGSALMGYGPSYAVVLVGRCVAGLGVGFALMIAPLYSAEISSAAHRGLLSSLPELCIALGSLLGYVSNYFFAKLTLKLGWRLMLGIAAIPSLALALGSLKMPESPRWLILQGRLAEAKRVLRLVCNSEQEAESRFQDIKIAAEIDENCDEDVVKLPRKTRGEGVWKELLLRPSPTVRWILLAGVGIHFFEHATGISGVILYSPRIFKKAGVTGNKSLLLATVGVGLARLASVVIAACLLDRVGRRILLLVGTVGMIVALTGLGFCLTMAEHAKERLSWALLSSIVATYGYAFFFSIGLGPVTWVYSSEIFPLRLRAQGMSIGVAVNRLMNSVVSISFLMISKAITIGGTFFMFAGVSVLALAFFYFFLPETKGKSLEEIEMLFAREKKSEVIDKGKGIQLNGTKS
ncbi:hypothetical protein BT93_H0164 [Corymbia citriodora subsp. variegata]|nr:hypothetical protein BT93_H0164 [Corymbia citriodora subsp. variegata]